MSQFFALRKVCSVGALCLSLAMSALPASAATLVVAATKTPGGFDGDALKPNTQNVVVQVYEGLTKYGYKKDKKTGRMLLDPGTILPHLAAKWTASPDGKTYTFELRKGVKSPFGNELTSADVVWGWEKSSVPHCAHRLALGCHGSCNIGFACTALHPVWRRLNRRRRPWCMPEPL